MPAVRNGDRFTVTATQEVTFSVALVERLKDAAPELVFGDLSRSQRRAVVVDANVWRVYAKEIGAYFHEHGVTATVLPLEVDEGRKDFDTYREICLWLVERGLLRRAEPIIAIGGGVLTDLVGFAAAGLRRGTPWVRIVTSGQIIDAGVSPKTGINCQGKSTLGAFHPPMATIGVRSFLATVEAVHLRDMMAEAVKAAIMRDARLFGMIEQDGGRLLAEGLQGPDGLAMAFLDAAVWATLDDNADNTWETNLRRRLHYGHTWGPTWENEALRTGQPLTHGEGVALDMALSAVVAADLKLTGDDTRNRILGVLSALGLPTWHPVMDERARLSAATASATAARDGQLLAPMAVRIGDADAVEYVSDIDPEHLADAVVWLRSIQG